MLVEILLHVTGIVCCSIQLTPKQDSSIHIPSVSNNTGSLPDLSGLQFTASTPEDSASDTSHHHIGPMRSSGTQGSPGSRHRRARSGPKPLVLHSTGHTHYQVTALLVHFDIWRRSFLGHSVQNCCCC